MWVEKIIVEIIGEDSRISSFVISDKRGEPMLISERRRFFHGARVPYEILMSESNTEIIFNPNKIPESCIQRGDIIELHIRWLYIPLRENFSAVCYWLRLPKNAVIKEVRKHNPRTDWNYGVAKDDDSRNLWLRCMFSREETNSLDFVLRYTLNPKDFDEVKQKESLGSWKDDLEHAMFGESNKSVIEKVFTILRKFLRS